MSTQRTDNDAKRMGGYLKEKWTIGMSRVSSDELQRALIKVTSHKLKVPNEKHLERLISATHGNINTGSNQYDDVPGYIVSELEAHTHSRNWVVVLKTLIVYHELMNQGSDKVLQCIASHRQPFNTSHMKDLADSPDGAMQEGFVHAYARYLEERCVTIASCRLQTRIESEEFLQHFLEISPASAAPVMAALLLQLEVLLNVDLRESALNNHATMHAFKRVIDDGRRLYAVTTRRMAAVLEGFVGYPHPDKKAWVQLFSRYQQATKKLADLFSRMNATPAIDFGDKLPTLKTMPDSIIVQLENFLLDDDANSSNVTVSRLDRSALAGSNSGDGAATATRSKSPELFKRKLVAASAESQPPPTASPFAAIAGAAAAAPAGPAGATSLSGSQTAPAHVAQQQPAKADPLADLFGGASDAPQPTRKAASPPPAAAAQVHPGQGTTNSMDDLFAPAPVAKQAAPLPSQQRGAAAPPAAGDFDPFAPAPASQWQTTAAAPAPHQQQGTGGNATTSSAANGSNGGSMDFFATGAQPAEGIQQQHDQQRHHQQHRHDSGAGAKGHGDDQLDFFAASSAKPAPSGGANKNGQARAW